LHRESLLSAEARERFSCLAYRPPAPVYRFVLILVEHVEKATVAVNDTGGQNRKPARWAGEKAFSGTAEQKGGVINALRNHESA